MLLNKIGMIWDTLEYEWEKKYKLLVQYKLKNGNILLDRNYEVYGIKLGYWLETQRKEYRKGALSNERIYKLEKLGIIWEVLEYNWTANYILAKKYYEEKNNLLIPVRYVINGIKLGVWLHKERNNYKNNKMSKEKIKLLEEIGMIWDPLEVQWEKNYMLAKEYYIKYKNLIVPINYSVNNVKLGIWISTQRDRFKKGIMKNYQIDKLNNINMIWEVKSRNQTSFAEQAIFYYLRKEFPSAINRYKDLSFEIDIFIPELKLGIEYDGILHDNINKDIKKNEKCKAHEITLIRIREPGCPILSDEYLQYKLKNTLDKELKNSIEYIIKYINNVFNKKLNIKIDLEQERQMIYEQYIYYQTLEWNENYLLAKKYYKSNGNLLIPINYKIEKKYLGIWISTHRNKYKNNKLNKYEIEMLNAIGMVWDVYSEQWEIIFNIAKEYYEEHNNLLVKFRAEIKGIKLGIWLETQRYQYKKGRLSIEQIEKLNSIGMIWNILEVQWIEIYKLATEYYNREGNLLISMNYTVGDIKLGVWISRQRINFKKGILTDERIKKLNNIGMIWDVLEYNWEEMYKLIKKYYDDHGNILINENYTINGIKIGKWLKQQRSKFQNKNLEDYKICKLNLLKMIWDPYKYNWNLYYVEARKFYNDNENLLISARYKINGINLGNWIQRQRDNYKNNNLSKEKIKLLEEIGMVWDPLQEHWEKNYILSKEYYIKYGNLKIKERSKINGVNLGHWLVRQKIAYKQNKLSNYRIKKLEEIGIKWN